MKIRLLTEDKYPEYRIIASESGSVFNDLNWLRIFNEKVKIYSIHNNEGVMIGGFFVYTEKKIGIKFIKCPPFTQTNGLFFAGRATNQAKITGDLKNLMTEIAGFYDSKRFGILRVSFPSEFTDFQPFIWKKFKVVPNYSYVHNLNLPVEELFSSFSAEKRNEIKKAEKDKIVISPVKDFTIIEAMIHETFERNKIKFSHDILNKILVTFANQDNSFAFTANNEHGILAFSYCVHDKKTAYYLFGGSSYENKHTGAGSATLWECVKRARILGLQKFDFEGSMNPKIEHYFRGFGGYLTPYFTINKANILIELGLTFIKREYF
jgi:lipid II:glycine glycyltransferase (peptidoglycan interpeptide bridge formation enzyme)